MAESASPSAGEPADLRTALEKALAALETCNPGDTSSGHVIYPSYDEDLCRDAEELARSTLAAAPAPLAAPYRMLDAGQVDCLGIALDLEDRAKHVESQTTQRAMLAGAGALRLILEGNALAAPAAGAVPTNDRLQDIIRDLLHSRRVDGYTPEQQAFLHAVAYRLEFVAAPASTAAAVPAEPEYDEDGFGPRDDLASWIAPDTSGAGPKDAAWDLAGDTSRPMVDIVPPATRRDRWFYEQGRLAERDPRTTASEPAGGAVAEQKAWTTEEISALAKPIAEAIAKNASTAPQLVFPHLFLGLEDIFARFGSVTERKAEPIDMVLHCPKCGEQHIDAPDERTPGWKNEQHRSHLCHGCGHIWRPADVPTNGVQAVKTTGRDDSPIAAPVPREAGPAEGVSQAERLWDAFIARLNEVRPLGDMGPHKNFLGSIGGYRKVYLDAAIASTRAAQEGDSHA